MNVMKAIGGGIVGSLIGTAIWVAIGYGTHREIGWIAWGIGALVGLGVRIASQEWHGPTPGAIAVAIALLSVVAGKFLVVSLIVRQNINNFQIEITDDDLMQTLAHDIVKDRNAKGKKVVWPVGMKAEDANKATDFPRDVWQEATKKWNSSSPDDKQTMRKREVADFARLKDAIHRDARSDAFKSSFGIFDLLWFGLAAFTAFRIGSGLSRGE